MTVVVGAEAPSGDVFLAHDGQVQIGETRFTASRCPKVVSVGPWAVGWAGTPHLGHLLRASGREVFRDLAPGEERPEAFFGLGRRIRDCLREDRYQPVDAAGAENLLGEILLAAHGSGLWFLDVQGTPYRIEPGQAMAVGSGAPQALAAYHALVRFRPHTRLDLAGELLAAVESAGAGDLYCGPPYTVGRVNGEGFEPLEAGPSLLRGVAESPEATKSLARARRS